MVMAVVGAIRSLNASTQGRLQEKEAGSVQTMRQGAVMGRRRRMTWRS
jgi:hypothetical protein